MVLEKKKTKPIHHHQNRKYPSTCKKSNHHVHMFFFRGPQPCTEHILLFMVRQNEQLQMQLLKMSLLGFHLNFVLWFDSISNVLTFEILASDSKHRARQHIALLSQYWGKRFWLKTDNN